MILPNILLTAAILAWPDKVPKKEDTKQEINNEIVDISIMEAVEHCFYDVELSKLQYHRECDEINTIINVDWIYFNAHCTRRNCKYLESYLRAVNIALAVHLALRHQKEDNQLALECAYLLRIPLDYAETDYVPLECQAIWHKNKDKAARPIAGSKRFLALVKYFATVGWFPSAEIFGGNRKAAVDCYGNMRNDSSVRYEACRGITWTGNSRLPTPPPARQYPKDVPQWRKDADDYTERMQWPARKAYYREMVQRVPKPGRYVHLTTQSNFTSEELIYLAEEYEETAEFKQDSALVEYCYFEPQGSKNVTYLEQCAGIAFDRPNRITTLKQAKLMRHLDFYDSMYKSHRMTQQKLVEQGRIQNFLPKFELTTKDEIDKDVVKFQHAKEKLSRMIAEGKKREHYYYVPYNH